MILLVALVVGDEYAVLIMLNSRLSQMILDQIFYGVLNENSGTLEVYDEPTDEVSKNLQSVIRQPCCASSPASLSLANRVIYGQLADLGSLSPCTLRL